MSLSLVTCPQGSVVNGRIYIQQMALGEHSVLGLGQEREASLPGCQGAESGLALDTIFIFFKKAFLLCLGFCFVFFL